MRRICKDLNRIGTPNVWIWGKRFNHWSGSLCQSSNIPPSSKYLIHKNKANRIWRFLKTHVTPNHKFQRLCKWSIELCWIKNGKRVKINLRFCDEYSELGTCLPAYLSKSSLSMFAFWVITLVTGNDDDDNDNYNGGVIFSNWQTDSFFKLFCSAEAATFDKQNGDRMLRKYRQIFLVLRQSDAHGKISVNLEVAVLLYLCGTNAIN